MRKRIKLREVPVGTDVTFENGVTITVTEERLLRYLSECRDEEVWIDVPDSGVRVASGNGSYTITCDGAEAWHGTGAEAVDVLARILRDVNNNPARSKNVMVLQVWLSSHLVSAKLESESKRFQ